MVTSLISHKIMKNLLAETNPSFPKNIDPTRPACFNPRMSTQNAERKKLYIKTYGCQMNVYDSRRMEDVLRPLGYDPVDTPDEADMAILNTCHIRERATDKVFSDLGRLRDFKTSQEQNGKKMIIAVAGCVAQAEGDVIMDRAKYVDMVFGPQTYHQLPEMVAEITGAYGKARVVNTDFPVEEKFDLLPGEQGSQGVAAFLSIQEGCDKFCTFCVVPYTRGSEYSRNVQSVLDEARRLVDHGAKDITLLGQNVNAYHGVAADGSVWGLGRLLRELSKINGLERLRYTTSHPRDVDDDLIAAHRDLPKVMPYLHLPVQSGSDGILKAMNRKHTAASFRDTIARFRDAQPGLALSSDFIVGFPGETDQDFEDTYTLVKETGFAFAYAFSFSARPGTPAANMQNLVREDVKTSRLHRLQELLWSQHAEFNAQFVGKTIPVLLDGLGNREGFLHGRTPHNQGIHVAAPKRLNGEIVDVVVTASNANALTGEVRMAAEAA